MIRVIMAAGGTGGHLFPALALAEGLREGAKEVEILFVGSGTQLEERVIAHFGYSHETVPAAGLKGVGLLGRLRGLARLPLGFFAAHRLIGSFDPDIVIGIGGYASGTVLLDAGLRRIPSVLVEPNAIVGITNRLLGPLADRVYLASKRAASSFSPSKQRMYGNPLRHPFVRLSASPIVIPSEGPINVLVVGGSQGARRLNELMIGALDILRPLRGTIRVAHQTGEGKEAAVAEAYKKAEIVAEVEPFFEDMAEMLACCHLVISRAGATAIAEIAAVGRASILVPFPFATDNHQWANAEMLVLAGAAERFDETQLAPERLGQEITSLVSDRERLRRMAMAARRCARPRATEQIIDDCLDLLSGAKRARRSSGRQETNRSV